MFKHHKEVTAWMAGQTVQRKMHGKWVDYISSNECDQLPLFSLAEEHRIKPQVTTTKDMWVCVEEFNGWAIGDLLMNEPGLGYRSKFRKTSVAITVEV